MDPNFISSILAPSLAILVSVVTYWITSKRTQQLDDRAAAKETVELLATQNKILLGDITDLRERIRLIEQSRDKCEEQLMLLTNKLNGINNA